ncbi:DNA-binding response regulator [Candidatus Epulonipiscium fishelsonii]|uniref:DNA-binding response regulator n=1 Tax=Candidatus Epulonipiscium fishelsonii TaxID=77094 RepID=A0ACC8X9U5_9FIRM|nr:DNA-binding response regulator [Epulopiscium sp. SCG-B11WGA-EpuloA1]ONI39338.1 DNA-binding response regulator [Epulopiscium sp. SCG-B05WGA-EpuloA1]
MKTVYLVEDEQVLSTLLVKYLQHEGYIVTAFVDGLSALKSIPDSPDIWLLDINLPDISGYDLIKKIKEFNSKIPVIFMSARNEELDRVIGLELGSEDYIAKPFLPRELVLRTKNLLERVYGKEEKLEDIIQLNSYQVQLKERVIRLDDVIIQLTTKEFELVVYFINNKNCVVTREQILNAVWGQDYFGSDRVVDDTVRRIRKKLPDASLETIYGYGYKWII